MNEENPASTVTMHDLRLLYSLYRRSWDRGVRVLLVLPEPETPAMDFLSTEVFRERDANYVEQYYLTALFQQRIAELPQSSGDLLEIGLIRESRLQNASIRGTGSGR